MFAPSVSPGSGRDSSFFRPVSYHSYQGNALVRASYENETELGEHCRCATNKTLYISETIEDLQGKANRKSHTDF